MKTMTFFVLFSMISTVAAADIVKMETNDWNNQRTLIWSGTLRKVDPATQVACFSFKNGSQIEEFQVHITRIYSLTLDNQDRVNKPFPATQQDLKTPLPTNPRSTEILELTNENFVSDTIPAEVKVRPDRNSTVLYLCGTIKHGDLQKMMLEVKAENRAMSAFEISRSDLLKWIRGR